MEESMEKHPQDSFSDNDDDLYIEIELDPCAVAPTRLNSEQDKINLNKESEECELRISISSTIPVPPVQHSLDYSQQTETSVASSALTPPLLRGTSTDSPLNHSSLNLTQTTDDQPRLKFPPLNRLFNFNLFWENRQSDHAHITMQTSIPFNSYNNKDLQNCTRHSTRKQGSMTTRNGGIMKMLIKFRGIKLRTLLASLVKPRPPSHDNKGHKSSRKCRTILQCYQKGMVINPSGSQERSCSNVKKGEARKSKHWDLNNNEDSFRSTKRSNSSVVEIDLGALRGIFSAVGISQKGSSKRKSCSTSSDTSPIHEGFSLSSSDNSIQAAIAYCKTSFGQSSDFSF